MRDLPRYYRSVSAARRRLPGAMSAMVLLIAVAWVLPASAAERIPLEQQVLFGEEGSTYELAEVAVEPSQVGVLCTMEVDVENQSSVHPDNDLIITTGANQAVISDIESVADANQNLSTEVVLGPTIKVELRFGRHRISSMGFGLDVDCGTTGPILTDDDCSDPTSTTATSSSSTTSSSSSSSTTSSSSTSSSSTSSSTTSSTSTSSSTTTSTSSGTSSTTAGDGDDCPDDDPPVTEVSVPPTTVPESCPEGGDGALTVDGDGCTDPTVLGTTTVNSTSSSVAESTTTEVRTTSTTTSQTATSAANQVTTTTTASTTTTTSATSPSASVLGETVEKNLGSTPPATAVQANPDYAG